MNQTKADAIVAQLLANSSGLRYGSVSVSAKLHDGRVVEVTYTKTEQTRKVYVASKPLADKTATF